MNKSNDSLKNDWKFKLLYDGECPFCKREIAWMAKHDKKGNLAFEDITAPNFDPTRYGLTRKKVMGVIHGVFYDGRIIEKVAVFIEAYRLLGLGWLVAPLSWPLIAYELFARYRVPLGNLFGRHSCSSSRCNVEFE